MSKTIKCKKNKNDGKLILVTAITPTPAGEGKTTTSVGLTDGLNKIGKKSIVCLREPSLGPSFGMKGGAAGGGYAQVVPMEQINLHFTGDFHAITSAHNLLSALIDNHIYWGNKLNIDPENIVWKRVVDLNDRALRKIEINLEKLKANTPRNDSFDITVASEVMAIFCLSNSILELEEKIGNITVAYSKDKKPIYAKDLKAQGPMTVLLKEAVRPNVVQTLENNLAIIHGGPFANIAHGNSSIIGDRLALGAADIVVTEAGFGSDMGAEKFMHIKAANSGKAPDCVVMNVTVRSMKLHGGAFGSRGGYRPSREELDAEDIEAVKRGAQGNLDRHIRNMAGFGMPVIVSINRFTADTDGELDALSAAARASGAHAVTLTEVHANGGKGGEPLAKAVVSAIQDHVAAGRPFTPLFLKDAPVMEKVNGIAKRIYKAEGVDVEAKAKKQLAAIESWGYGHLPVCMAKTQYSFSHDAGQLGAPVGFTIPVREFRLNAGAGFIVAVLGNMMTMPGLPKRPAAADMDMDENGHLIGVFG